ncbi:diguanylate cyclase (GGDEF)-like protein [Mesobacillus foraminis]|uniref:Diguanylate cyclase (GGDEF)-like protein n=1 Tax=Mesobacillus foraminis TaxID=279826 RepID=A0A4R2BEE1_9BACI|nr:diguanylate cyclase (GGDEF)-like protein [Mesobacillus foraminis]
MGLRENVKSLDELKRNIYSWILPFIVFTLFLNTILQNSCMTTLSGIVNISLIVWFSISWVLVRAKQSFRFTEISNLILISIYHIIKFSEVLFVGVLVRGQESLGDFIIWMPLYILYIFLTLKRRQGLFLSLMVLLVTFIVGMTLFREITTDVKDSLIQFYAAHFVYTLVLFYIHYLFTIHTELNLVRKQSQIDSLTGIFNRQHMDELLAEKLMQRPKENKPLSVIFLDIDHFKCINDRFGHDMGDWVLKEFTRVISARLTDTEFFGRWGGEEFVIITDSGLAEAGVLAERLRVIIEQHTFQSAGKVTCSFGVSSYQNGDDALSLIKRADEGLYLSKTRGRNQVLIN